MRPIRRGGRIRLIVLDIEVLLLLMATSNIAAMGTKRKLPAHHALPAAERRRPGGESGSGFAHEREKERRLHAQPRDGPDSKLTEDSRLGWLAVWPEDRCSDLLGDLDCAEQFWEQRTSAGTGNLAPGTMRLSGPASPVTCPSALEAAASRPGQGDEHWGRIRLRA